MGYEIDFLPVGEGEKSGDAIALRYGNLHGNRNEQTVVVIDGGFKQAGEQLVQHIKQHYKTNCVDLVISTHPDADHVSGLEVILEQMKVSQLWMHLPWNHTNDIAKLFEDGRVTDISVKRALRESLDAARGLEKLATKKGISILEPFAGLQDDGGGILVVGPTKKFYEKLLPYFLESPEAKDSESPLARVLQGVREAVSKVFEQWNQETLTDEGITSARNNSSTILLLAVDERLSLLTGDAGIPALEDASYLFDLPEFDRSKFHFVQVPHHGSKRNVGPTILDKIVRPKQQKDDKQMTAFVSASKDAQPKHPSKRVTNAFRRRGAWVYATQGTSLRHHHDAPARNWKSATPLDFYNEFEE